MILDIIIWPDSKLKIVAAPIFDITDETRDLAANMLETCKKAGGRGLAATQVGAPHRLLVIDDSEAQDGRDLKVFLNPRWIEGSKAKSEGFEGCLSVPGEAHKISRFDHITVTAETLEGATVEFEAKGERAAAWQHEVDHLDGIVYVEYLGTMRRDVIRRKTVKFKREVEQRLAEIERRVQEAAEHARMQDEARDEVAQQEINFKRSGLTGG